jgi:hypothetical protein
MIHCLYHKIPPLGSILRHCNASDACPYSGGAWFQRRSRNLPRCLRTSSFAVVFLRNYVTVDHDRFSNCPPPPPTPQFIVHSYPSVPNIAAVSGVPRNFIRGGGGVNKFSWGQRERGSGDSGPLVRDSGGSCNLVQEISFHIVKFN